MRKSRGELHVGFTGAANVATALRSVSARRSFIYRMAVLRGAEGERKLATVSFVRLGLVGFGEKVLFINRFS